MCSGVVDFSCFVLFWCVCLLVVFQVCLMYRDGIVPSVFVFSWCCSGDADFSWFVSGGFDCFLVTFVLVCWVSRVCVFYCLVCVLSRDVCFWCVVIVNFCCFRVVLSLACLFSRFFLLMFFVV